MLRLKSKASVEKCLPIIEPGVSSATAVQGVWFGSHEAAAALVPFARHRDVPAAEPHHLL
jgi:hypothetical protein